ncbi:hypothetical protein P153DRAFT_366092 [Dothidotthia symphoricarpi CBS 119687]|uniref:Uncharacterized protein n=1 Tax=Dothidotthia symphoricarpi CBS 119687 TaxID=1392245 RepID=A0A6A6AHG0_9PLEO|nr:uncharacterized protein P153DRAFT_366092 [Dothidotthia symphoricarpi CBS 119687]KAF2130508.1 hypothetical protein P153DRAFT_366092 [Dothidotthia symphoricarpi CBS 119687]
MPLPALAPSTTNKQDLFNRLEGLTERYYRQMLDEAGRARDELSKDPDNLVPEFRDNPSVVQPYTLGNLSATAKHRTVLKIASAAKMHLKPFYDEGAYTTTVSEENWVALWYLWHSFRHRDNKSKSSKPKDGLVQGDGHGSQSSAYYDPVRGCVDDNNSGENRNAEPR